MKNELKKESVYKLLNEYENDFNHVNHVKNLSLLFFDKTKPFLHNFTDAEKELIWAGALLHDIGHAISDKDHHKSSCRIILKKLENFTEKEKIIISNIARYHKGKEPLDEHFSFNLLTNKEDKLLTTKLASFVKIADGMDRSHTCAINDFNIEYFNDNNTLDVNLCAIKQDISEEYASLKSKKILFENAFGIKIKFKKY